MRSAFTSLYLLGIACMISISPCAMGQATVSTNAATNVLWHSAVLNGVMNPHGSLITASFDYGLTTTYTNNIGSNPGQSSANTSVLFDATITGLTQNTAYHYRAKIFDGTAFTYGPDHTFLTKPPVPPNVTNERITYIPGDTHCTFLADVNANSFTTRAYIQYSLASDNFNAASILMTPAVMNGTSPTPVSYLANDLQVNNRYIYRVIATNTWGSDTGTVISFSTSASAGITSGQLPDGLVMSPNPVGAMLQLDAAGYSPPVSISIFNCQGQQMKVPVTLSYTIYQFNTSTLPSGPYWLRVLDSKKTNSIAFVKQ